jgi:YidC/Oxa1 family membrane protein insertase
MESNLRMLLAIILSFLVFLIYQFFFAKPLPTPKDENEKQLQQTQEKVEPDQNIQPLAEPTPIIESPIGRPELKPAQSKRITVSTPLYIASFIEERATLTGFKLTKYRETIEPNSPRKVLISAQSQEEYSLGIQFVNHSIQGLDDAVFQADTEQRAIDAVHAQKNLAFSWESPQGYRIIKTYTFYPDSYLFDLTVKVSNPAADALEDNLTVALAYPKTNTSKSRYIVSGPAILLDNELQEISYKEITKKNMYSGRIGWIALEDRYFITALIPDGADKMASVRLEETSKHLSKAFYIDPANIIPPKTERTYRYQIYMGPKSLNILSSTNKELARVVDFGWFDIIAKPLLHVLNFLNRYVHNYGIAIIILTILIKIVFWPLTNKSYQSMSDMKKLQPKITELRQKYKNDKQKMNQELMNLYRTYNINPLGGCLPMILQIPVFFAFYKVLYQAIELRHAPFFGWINDLAAPDRLFHFNFSIPLMEPPYGIPVLTIIMGASMFIQQKMSPPPGDPAQAKIMMAMPIIFTFIFINFPSGLVLYWLFNNILSIVQQYYITKKTA